MVSAEGATLSAQVQLQLNQLIDWAPNHRATRGLAAAMNAITAAAVSLELGSGGQAAASARGARGKLALDAMASNTRQQLLAAGKAAAVIRLRLKLH